MGQQQEQIDYFKNLAIDITAIQEMIWIGKGNIKMENAIVFWSGIKSKPKYELNGFIAKIPRTAVTTFKQVSEIIYYIRLNDK